MIGFRILIVEDEEGPRKALMVLFRDEFAKSFGTSRIDTAGTPVEAVWLIREAVKEGNPYDLAIIDLVLPDPNGDERFSDAACTELDRVSSDTAIIHMTGNAADSDVQAHCGSLQSDKQGERRHSSYNFVKANFTRELVALSLKLLHSGAVQSALRRLARNAGQSMGDASRSAITSQLREVKLEILSRWVHLDDRTKDEVRRAFEVMEEDGKATEVHLK